MFDIGRLRNSDIINDFKQINKLVCIIIINIIIK